MYNLFRTTTSPSPIALFAGGVLSHLYTRTLIAVLYEESQRLVVALHGADRDTAFQLPKPRDGHTWHLLIDTARDAPALDPALEVPQHFLLLAPRSVVLLAERPVPA